MVLQRQPKRALGVKKVKNTYKNVEEYLGTFEPLLFEEVKANIARDMDEDEGVVFFPYWNFMIQMLLNFLLVTVIFLRFFRYSFC